jgi:hypothetical protein
LLVARLAYHDLSQIHPHFHASVSAKRQYPSVPGVVKQLRRAGWLAHRRGRF